MINGWSVMLVLLEHEHVDADAIPSRVIFIPVHSCTPILPISSTAPSPELSTAVSGPEQLAS